MKIALIGATGYLGSKILSEALNRGHHVTGIVRNIDKLSSHSLLNPQQGDIYDEDGLAKLLAGHDIVISSVQFTHSDLPALIRAVKKSKVPRYLVMGGCGSLYIKPGLTVVEYLKPPPNPVHKDPKAEARTGVEFLKMLKAESDLNWTFFSPSGIDKPIYAGRTGKYRLGRDDLLRDENGDPTWISAEDVAVAMIDEVETPRHQGMRFTAGY